MPHNDLLEALQSPNTIASAHALLECGVSVIPLHGKKPSIKWETHRRKIASMDHFNWWVRAGLLHNVGVVCGGVSGNLVVIDVDALVACSLFEMEFPHLADTLTVRTSRGRHYYYYADALPSTTISNPYELRADGCYVVAPPSIHPHSGQPYRVERECAPLRVPNLTEVRRWIQARGGNAVTPRPAFQSAPVKDESRYGAAVLAAEALAVTYAPSGKANDTLNRAAFKCGQLVASGHLTETQIEDQLFRAADALSKRDGEAATRRTIRSGLNAGMNNPRRSA